MRERSLARSEVLRDVPCTSGLGTAVRTVAKELDVRHWLSISEADGDTRL